MIRLDFAPLLTALAATNLAALLFWLGAELLARRTRRGAEAPAADPLESLIRAIEDEERGGKERPSAAGSCRPLRTAS